ncbi:MAG: di-heme-cytochrome C peroxidase [Gammaproteobacteria bacterium]|nr:di-heme-cytochrome C peroxidase [Gammaproteobacteria bacterium]
MFLPNSIKLFFINCLGFSLLGCAYITQGPFPDNDRGALASHPDFFGDKADKIIYPDQNWGRADSLWYYNTTQGSDLLPYDVFLYLEQADKDKLFRDTSNMLKYRYLPQKPTWDNPDGLPLGWVKDRYKGKDYVGLTCAACHTTQVNYKGYGIRIDGGPAMADMETMIIDLTHAVKNSMSGEKFLRLAKKVLANEQPEAKSLETFKQELESLHQTLAAYVNMNTPRHQTSQGEKIVHYGYARLDAFGRIYNRILAHVSTNEIPKTNPANAPVSYPFLWDTPHHDFVQWNGVADNATAVGLGPVARNTGEVLGVFATFNVKESKRGSLGYPSSAETRNQIRLEDHLKDLWSPSWRQLADIGALKKIDGDLAKKGEQVFVDYQCGACHEAIKRTDKKRVVVAQFSSVDWIGTDPQMASNAILYCGDVGVLKNANLGMCAADLNEPALSGVLPILQKVTTGVMTYGLVRKLGTYTEAIINNPLGLFQGQFKTRRHVELEVTNKAYLNAYKGRPLNGIWATAPYLHNGSVPNLYELFLPSCSDEEIQQGKKCRSNKFTVGNRELDVKKVGFKQFENPAQFQQPALFVFDTSLPSNSNKGHEYAAGKTPMPKLVNGKVQRDEKGEIIKHYFKPMEEEERWALVEYLKTL